MSSNAWLSIANPLNSFLSSVLSKYLDYKEEKDGALKVGLWGGTLDLRNVQLRSEAFYQVLNMWKKPQRVEEGGGNDGDNGGHGRNPHEAGTSMGGAEHETVVDQNGPNVTELPNLSYFLSEEALLLQNSYSASSALDVTLLEGSIGQLQAKLPWKNFIMNGDAVTVEASDVTIQLGLTSRVGLALNDSSKQQEIINALREVKSQDVENRIKAALEEKLSEHLRNEKQTLIRRALDWLSGDKQGVSPLDYSKTGDVDSDSGGNELDDKTNMGGKLDADPEESPESERPPTKSFLQQFVGWFTSSLGWRIGMVIEVEVKNIEIFLKLDGVEIGIMNQSFNVANIVIDDELDEPEKKKDGNLDHTSNHSFQTEPDTATSQIQKVVKASGFCIFIRREPTQSLPPTVDNYLLHPTDISCSFCLRNAEEKIKLDLNNELGKNSHEVDSDKLMDATNLTISPEKPKLRRGKREKALTHAEVSDSIEHPPQKPLETKTPIGAPENEEEEKVYTEDSFPIRPRLSIDIDVQDLKVFVSSHNAKLIRTFMFSFSERKNGKPERRIKEIPEKNRTSSARQWWKYAIFSVLREVRKKRLLRKCVFGILNDWSFHQRMKQSYMKAYTDFLDEGAHLETADKVQHRTKMILLEDSLCVEQILLFRKLSENLGRPTSREGSISDDHSIRLIQRVSFGAVGNPIAQINTAESADVAKGIDKSTDKVPKHQRGQALTLETRGQLSSKVPRSRNRRAPLSGGESEDKDSNGLYPDNWSTALEEFEQIQEDELKAEVIDSLTSSTSICLLRFSFFVTSSEHGLGDIDEQSKFDNEHYRVLLSSLTYGLRLTFKSKSNEKKVGNFLVDGLCLQVGDNDSFYAGKLQRPLTKSRENVGAYSRRRLYSTSQIANFFNYEKVDSSCSFFEAKFSLNIKNGNYFKSSNLKSRPLIISVTMSQISGSIDVNSYIKNAVEISHVHVPLGSSTFVPNITIWTEDDERALDFYEQTRPECVSIITKNKIFDISFELKGITLFLPISKMVANGILFRTGLTLFHIGPTSALTTTLSRQKFRLLEVEKTLQETQGASSMLLMVSDLGLETKSFVGGDANIIEKPIDINILYSAYLGTNAPLITAATSLIDITLSTNQCKLIHSTFFPSTDESRKDQISDLHGNESMMLEAVDIHDADERSVASLLPARNYSRTRVAKIATAVMFSAKVWIPFFVLTLTNDQKEKTGSSKVSFAIKEILSDYLSFISCFEKPYPIEPMKIAFEVATDRVHAAGYSEEIAMTYIGQGRDIFYSILERANLFSNESTNSIFYENEIFDGTRDEDSALVHISDLSIQRIISISINRAFDSIKNIPLQYRPWGGELIAKFPSGLALNFERLTYDTKINGEVKSFTLSNRAGIHFIKINNDQDKDISEFGFQFTAFRKDINYDFGIGGSTPFSIEVNRQIENDFTFQVESLAIMFANKDVERVFTFLSGLLNPFLGGNIPDKCNHDEVTMDSVLSQTFDGIVHDCQVMFFSDEWQPFCKLQLQETDIQTLSSLHLVQSSLTSLICLAESENVLLHDLTPEGQYFGQVIIPVESIDVKSVKALPKPFELSLTLSSDPFKCPTELLIVLEGLRIMVLRRFVNELVQYFLSPDHGLGCCLKSLSDQKSRESLPKPRPMNFQVPVVKSTLILPKDSENDDLIALKTNKLLLTNGFHTKSWNVPNVSVDDISKVEEDEEENVADFHDCENEPSIIEDSESEDPTIMCSDFDPSNFFRLNVSAEKVRMFTGICDQGFAEGDNITQHQSLQHFMSINEVEEGQFVFEQNDNLIANLPIRNRLTELCRRKWEEVTENPVQLEIYVDFLPSHIRLLLKDHINFDSDEIDEEVNPFALDLRMSQLYAILTVWYGNMQELPIMFPYRSEAVRMAGEVPPCKVDWPEYGSNSYVQKMEESEHVTFEIAISIRHLKLGCCFDYSNLKSGFMLNSEEDGIALCASGFVVHVVFDADRVMKVGMGAYMVSINDRRENRVIHRTALSVGTRFTPTIDEPLDLTWGLKNNRVPFSGDMKIPFQMTLYMTPDRNCLINLGLDGADIHCSNLACIWLLLEYFSSYFIDEAFGHPYFEALRSCSRFRRCVDNGDNEEETENRCMNIDFRLWLHRPNIKIPSDPRDSSQPYLELLSDRKGAYYRYRTIGYGFVSQEICARHVNVCVVNGQDMKKLVQYLNLNMIYDWYPRSNHTNLSVSIPVDDNTNSKVIGIEPPDIQVQPMQLPKPQVIQPSVMPSRAMNSTPCEVLFSPENLKLAVELLSNFVGPYPLTSSTKESSDIDDRESENVDKSEASFSVSMYASGLRLLVIDPSLALHHPIIAVCIPKLLASVSQLSEIEAKYVGNGPNVKDLQVCIEPILWVDYFKSSPTRSWEPLIEPYQCTVLYENSLRRGRGIIVKSACPFHINITSAFLESLEFAIDSFQASLSEVFNTNTTKETRDKKAKVLLESSVSTYAGAMNLLHKKVPHSSLQERVAFSLSNLAGQEIRVHLNSASETDAIVHYLDHMDAMSLQFPATRSIIQNLKVVEVPFEETNNRNKIISFMDRKHIVDVQIPGMRWAKDICVDLIGKKFVPLQPKSFIARDKVKKNWRLGNVFQLLTEVSFSDGGRHLSVTSPFEIVNKTGHQIQLAMHPDPKFSKIKATKHGQSFEKVITKEDDNNDRLNPFNIDNEADVQQLNPGKTYNVPFLLLGESLHYPGKNLGNFWIRPGEGVDVLNKDSSVVGFSSHPVQISKLIDNSDLLYNRHGRNTMNSEIFNCQLSCPIKEEGKESRYPFCYNIEIERSPVVAPFPGHEANVDSEMSSCSDSDFTYGKSMSPFSISETLTTRSKENQSVISNVKSREEFSINNVRSESSKPVEKKGRMNETRTHGPVAYSLVIHPPIVITNFLPETVRYELMHATRRQVIWWKVLEAGESVPIHTVGLDAPLLLLLNAGYCRTPVGEGALIHVGTKKTTSDYSGAVKTATKGAGKVKNAIIDLHRSAEVRGERKLKQINSSGFSPPRDVTSQGNNVLQTDNDASDIVDETTVVDSLGQRLIIKIQNILGKGGERKITMFCPFWILNTTEHSLRYRQEKASAYVSGTVRSSSEDGSKPVDDSHRNHSVGRTIFPGKPGALASKMLNRDDMTRLLCKEMPLKDIAAMSAMFNFSRDVISFGARERLTVQLANLSESSTWTSSDWSRAFSLESVGVTQPIGMHCMHGRLLEVAVTISVAPGKLCEFTKIVRFSPRFVLVNKLSRPIRLWQDSSLVHPSRVKTNSQRDSNIHANESDNWKIPKADNISTDKSSRKSDLKYHSLFGKSSILDYEKEVGIARGTMAHRSALYITTAGQGDIAPFYIQDTRIDKELRIDLGPHFNLTSSFAADVTNDHVLKITRVVDLSLITHVDNRATPRYDVSLPPSKDLLPSWDGELGVWFETLSWNNGETKIVVKGTRRGSFSFENLDIRDGDELVEINGEKVDGKNFRSTMSDLNALLLELRSQKVKKSIFSNFKYEKTGVVTTTQRKDQYKNYTNEFSSEEHNRLVLTFQTLENRMKEIREQAIERKNISNSLTMKQISNKGIVERNADDHRGPASMKQLDSVAQKDVDDYINASVKLLNQTMFIFVHDKKSSPVYRVDNRSIAYMIYFRQRGCEAHPWNSLAPGDSIDYTWEEPIKPNRLLVRVGNHNNNGFSVKPNGGKKIFPLKIIENEDQGVLGKTQEVNLDEIGHKEKLSSPISRDGSVAKELYCKVDTEGMTRVLVITDAKASQNSEELNAMIDPLNTLSGKIRDEKTKLQNLKSLIGACIPPDIGLITVPENETVRVKEERSLETNLTELGSHPKDSEVTSTNQVFIEVLEASGLHTAGNSSGYNGLCSPYCSIKLEEGLNEKGRNLFLPTKRQSKRTYFIEKSVSPKWTGMKFVFDVPAKARDQMNGFSIKVKVKDFHLVGKHSSLGRVEIQLRSLKDQKEILGWFPLLGRNSRGGNLTSSTGRFLGSIKLRVLWIYTAPALLDYYILLSERHLKELEINRQGILSHFEKLKKAETEIKHNTASDLLSRIEIPALTLHDTRQKILEGKPWSMRQTIKLVTLRHLWSRQKTKSQLKSNLTRGLLEESKSGISIQDFGNTNGINIQENMPNTFPKESTTPLSLESLEKGSKDFQSSAALSSAKGGEPHRVDIPLTPEDIESDVLLRSSRIVFSNKIPFFHRRHMKRDRIKGNDVLPLFINETVSWSMVYVLLNDQVLKKNYVGKDNVASLRHSVNYINEDFINMYPSLSLPHRAPSLIHKRNSSFLSELFRSRELFDKSAQRSLEAVFNPGGCLHLRPITALNLPHGHTGMLVKVAYGSDSWVTSTVDSKMSPKWYDDSKPLIIEEEYKKNHENDLEVNCKYLNTSGSLRLSVIGSRLNTKVELGVLQIPLANAINCCAETSVKSDEYTHMERNGEEIPGVYERWFPLQTPKDVTNGKNKTYFQNMESEKATDDDFRTNYFTPCIKLAMWWSKKKDETSTDATKVDDCDKNNTHPLAEIYFNAVVGSVTASLIDSYRAKELLSLSSTNIDLKYSVNRPTTRMSFSLDWLQIDHHKKSDSVVLSPAPVLYTQPIFKCFAIKDNLKSTNDIDYFQNISVAMAEMDLRIEDALMIDVWNLICTYLYRNQNMQMPLVKASNRSMEHLPVTSNTFKQCSEQPNEVFEQYHAYDIESELSTGKKRIYIGKLRIDALKINISYIKNGPGYPRKQQHAEDIYKKWAETGEEYIVSQGNFDAFALISTLIPAITDAPIRIQGKEVDYVFQTWSKIFETLKVFYGQAMWHQIHKIIGSLDFVGNPTMVLSSFMKGAKDFVSIPFNEFLSSPTNPRRVGLGFARGTLSLFSHFFTGVFGFLSNISEAGGRATASLSLDENFKIWHHKHATDHMIHIDGQFRPRGPKRIVSVVSRPFQDVIEGIYYAITGVVIEPYRGARSGGGVGFAKGVGIGAVGLVAKPLVGVFDAFAHASDSIQDAATRANFLDKRLKPVKRKRMAYTFGPQKILTPFNNIHVKSFNFLRRFPLVATKGTHMENELLVTAELLQTLDGKQEYVIVTSKRIVLIEVQLIGITSPNRKWQLEFRHFGHIESRVDNFNHDRVILSVEAFIDEDQLRHSEGSTCLDKSNYGDSVAQNSHLRSPSRFARSTHSDAISNSQDRSLRPIFNKTRKEVERCKKFEVIGQFQHLKAMRKIHNAISCLVGNFDCIDYDVGTHITTEEGCTSFGTLHFTEISSDDSVPDEDIDNDMDRNLDGISWMHFDLDEDREKWRFHDELRYAEKDGGAKWIMEARARAFFTPLGLPPLPAILDPIDERVKQIQKQLKVGLISWQDAKTELQLHSNEVTEMVSLNLDSPIVLEGPDDYSFEETSECIVSMSDNMESGNKHSDQEDSEFSTDEGSSSNQQAISKREAALMQRIENLEEKLADLTSQTEPSIPTNMSRNLQYLPPSNSVISGLTGVERSNIEVPIHISEESDQQRPISSRKKKNKFRRSRRNNY